MRGRGLLVEKDTLYGNHDVHRGSFDKLRTGSSTAQLAKKASISAQPMRRLPHCDIFPHFMQLF
jgi:hypothetical protein